MKYDTCNGILAGQWSDSKVVAFISTLCEYDVVQVKRRIKRNKVDFDVPRALRTYQQHMGGVDKNDQIKECAGGFSKGIRKIHKWYKTVNLAIMDVGVVNSSIAHNMKAVTKEGIELGLMQATINDFQTYLADDMINFVHTEPPRPTNERSCNRRHANTSGCCDHVPSTVKPTTKEPVCRICKLEFNWWGKSNKNSGRQVKGTGYRSRSNLKKCQTCEDIGINVHLHDIQRSHEVDHFIFKIKEFKDLTCFEIFHHEKCKGLFKLDKKNKLQVQSRHPVMKELAAMWDEYNASTYSVSVTPQSQSPNSPDKNPIPLPMTGYPAGLQQMPGKLPPNWKISEFAAPNYKSSIFP